MLLLKTMNVSLITDGVEVSTQRVQILLPSSQNLGELRPSLKRRIAPFEAPRRHADLDNVAHRQTHLQWGPNNRPATSFFLKLYSE